MEQFSLESQSDFHEWKDAIERVLGIGGVEELLSEDEEGMDGASAEIEGMCVRLCICMLHMCECVHRCVCACIHVGTGVYVHM